MKNTLQKESLKQLLLAQKAQLLEKIKHERGGQKDRAAATSAQLAAAEQSHAQNISERDTAFAIQEHDVDELGAIEVALEQIADDTYGLCRDCGVEIPITRLLAFPTARRCLTCQSAAEKVAGPDAAWH